MPVNTKNFVKNTLKLTFSAMLILCLTACTFSAVPGTENVPEKLSKTDFVLDTSATITLYVAGGGEELLDRCFELCREYELIFSRTDPDSELYALNHAGSMAVSDELLELITLAKSYAELSDGAFDFTLGGASTLYGFSSGSPRAPSDGELSAVMEHAGWEKVVIDGGTVTLTDPAAVIDLGAIAKGWIADRLAEFLRENGVEGAIINLGGNVLCLGGKPDGEDFVVGLQYPFEDTNRIIGQLQVRDMSVVTSGVYQRCFEQDGVFYHHILDPDTGRPCDNGLLAVSVVGSSSAQCDALSTACFVLGPDRGLELVDSLDGVYAVFVTDDYAMHPSEGFENPLFRTLPLDLPEKSVIMNN